MGISKTGLTDREAAELLKKYGPNEFVEKPGKPLWLRFLEQFKDFMIIVLIAAAAISAALGETTDAVLIAIIVLIHGILGFVEEYKAEQAFAALKKLVAETARVLRNGEVMLLDIRGLVPGDLVLLEAGDRIPADGIVVERSALAADESALTGESIPVHKNSSNELFMGTVMVSGKGTMLIKNTGMATEMGRIASLVQGVEEERTPIEVDLDKLGKQIALGVLLLCVIIFIAGITRGFGIFDMFITSISLAVAAIPEGLPAVVAVVLAIGVQRMARKNAIIRKLKAVETLGCTTVIATDKTGTLTRNEMVIKKIYVNGRLIDVSGTGYEPKGEFKENGKTITPGKEETLILQIGALCNNAYLKEDARAGWSIIGDPTEGALLVLAAKGRLWREQLLGKLPEIAAFPFDSARKRMTTIHKEGNRKIAYTKGAPEVILKLCSSIAENGKVRKLAAADKKELEKINDGLTAKGYRTLALAWRKVDGIRLAEDRVEHDFVFIGIVAMIDAPRDEVKGALELCKSAGIKV
ncbi:MAG: HAD-IC family P-type ATPase, partial [Candidatus Micrarchaeota archaeon]